MFVVMSTSSTETSAVVRGARWERSIAVLGLVAVTHSDWWDEIPQGASVGQCRDELRRTVDTPVAGATEVCGTPYTVDTGTGVGRVQQDCKYEIRERMCEYTTQEWRVVTTRSAQGEGLNPQWPALSLAAGQREGLGLADGRDVDVPARTHDPQASHAASLRGRSKHGGQRLTVRDREVLHRARERDEEHADPVRIVRGDLRRLDDDHAVEFKAFGEGRRHDVQRMIR